MQCIMQPSCSCSARFTKLLQIESNTSDTVVGGVLTQNNASVHKPIAFLSRTLTSSEKSYSVYNCELFEIIACCKACCPYIDGQKTVVITDYKPLIYLYT